MSHKATLTCQMMHSRGRSLEKTGLAEIFYHILNPLTGGRAQKFAKLFLIVSHNKY